MTEFGDDGSTVRRQACSGRGGDAGDVAGAPYERLGATPPPDLPTGLILTHQPQLLQAATTFEATTPLDVGGLTGTIHTIGRTGGRVAVVGGFGIEAPAAASVLEEMIALGIDSFISVGAAGAIADLASATSSCVTGPFATRGSRTTTHRRRSLSCRIRSSPPPSSKDSVQRRPTTSAVRRGPASSPTCGSSTSAAVDALALGA